MNIFIVGYEHPKTDKRVFRTVSSLAQKAENKIIYQYWTDNINEKRQTQGSITYCPVFYDKNSSVSALYKLKRRKAFDNIIMDMILHEDYDVIIFNYFVISYLTKAFSKAKKRNKKIIYDIHELHPENFLNLMTGFKAKLKQAILWKALKKQLKLSDKVVYVSQEINEEIIYKTKVEKAFLIVPNYASVKLDPDPKKKIKDILYVGGVKRSLEQERKLISFFQNGGYTFTILGMKYKMDMEKVLYEEYKPYGEMMHRINQSRFSLVAYQTSGRKDYKNDLYALPHKFYDSVAAGTPVIIKKEFVSMAKLVEKYQIGVVADTSDIQQTALAIHQAEENYPALMENIRKFQDEFVWTGAKQKEYIDFITQL